MNRYFERPHSLFPSPVFPSCYQLTLLVGLPESSGLWIRSFHLSTSFHHGSPYWYITWGWTTDPLPAAVQRRSLTQWSSTYITYTQIHYHLISKCFNSSDQVGRRLWMVSTSIWTSRPTIPGILLRRMKKTKESLKTASDPLRSQSESYR
jgi:hypothetical protein